MYRLCVLLLLVCCNVLCDNCVVFNFEDDSFDDFSNEFGVCIGRSMWDLRRYDDLQMDAPHENSTLYVSPKSELSCMSSSIFPITGGGTLDIKLYMEPAAVSDQIAVIAFQHEPNGVVGNLILSPMDPNFTRGWQHLKMTLIGSRVYNGFVTLMGIASESSVIFIDSVRFIAPSYSEEICPIYEQDDTNGSTITTIVPETTSPIESEASSTVVTETDSTNVPETTSTIVPETPSTIAPETPSTNAPETPSTIAPDTPSTITPDTSSTIVPETASTIVPETTSSTVPEAP